MAVVGARGAGSWSIDGDWLEKHTSSNALYMDNAIQGKSISYQLTFSNVALEDRLTDKDLIKRELVQGLVQKMMEEKCIEFTMQEDHFMGSKICRARIFAVPDTQVRILREKGVI